MRQLPGQVRETDRRNADGPAVCHTKASQHTFIGSEIYADFVLKPVLKALRLGPCPERRHVDIREIHGNSADLRYS